MKYLIGAKIHRKPYCLCVAVITLVGLVSLTVWGIVLVATGSGREIGLLVALAWIVIAPAVGLILSDYFLSWVIFSEGHLTIKNMRSTKQVMYSDIYSISTTSLGLRILNSKGRVLGEIPSFSREYNDIKSLLDHYVCRIET